MQAQTRAAGLIALGALFLLCLGSGLFYAFSARLASDRSAVRHTYQVLQATAVLQDTLQDAETGQRGFLITGQDAYLVPYEDGKARVWSTYAALQSLTADSPAQQARLDGVVPAIQRMLDEMAATIRLRQEFGFEAARDLVTTDRGRETMEQIRTILHRVVDEENRQLDARTAAESGSQRAIGIIAAVGLAIALASFAAGLVIIDRSGRQKLAAEAAAREASNRLRAAFDAQSQGVAAFDSAGLLTAWNGAFATLLELPAGMMQPGLPYRALGERLAQGGAFLETEAQIAENDRAPGSVPVIYERQFAAGRALEIHRTSVADGGFVISCTDVTERKKGEETVRQSQKLQAVGQLTGGIAHDFNNLLTVILGNLESALPLTKAGSALRARLSGALRGAERGAALTRHLLTFSRRQALSPAPVDLNRLLSEMAGLLERTLGGGVDVALVPGAGLWPAFADPGLIETAILNLALNARDAMPDGGRLTIETANAALDASYAALNPEVEPGSYVMLAVSDTGQGMDAETLARAFEPFFTTKLPGLGTGLGLSMVYGFVQQSKGHVKIESQPGLGTTVKLYLPRAAQAAAELRAMPPAALPRGKATILVVEDDADVRSVTVRQLGELGYTVLEAADGEQAAAILEGEHGIDLVLTDLVLPGKLRGREVAELAQRLNPAMPVLFMSGYTEQAILQNGQVIDGIDLLRKPFRREALAQRIAAMLNRHATVDDASSAG